MQCHLSLAATTLGRNAERVNDQVRVLERLKATRSRIFVWSSSAGGQGLNVELPTSICPVTNRACRLYCTLTLMLTSRVPCGVVIVLLVLLALHHTCAFVVNYWDVLATISLSWLFAIRETSSTSYPNATTMQLPILLCNPSAGNLFEKERDKLLLLVDQCLPCCSDRNHSHYHLAMKSTWIFHLAARCLPRTSSSLSYTITENIALILFSFTE